MSLFLLDESLEELSGVLVVGFYPVLFLYGLVDTDVQPAPMLVVLWWGSIVGMAHRGSAPPLLYSILYPMTDFHQIQLNFSMGVVFVVVWFIMHVHTLGRQYPMMNR